MKLLKIGRAGEKPSIKTDSGALAILPGPKDTLGISEQAAQHLNFLLQKNNNLEQYLRVGIRGGGCSGLTLYYEFCDTLRPNDKVFERDAARICIDPKSLSFLGGATLHYKEALGVGELVLINNPSEKQCSCGKSFAL
jgi:iron-sulfur cluster assembly accessory protein